MDFDAKREESKHSQEIFSKKKRVIFFSCKLRGS